MKKYLFIGDYKNNAGPSNVNRSLKKYLPNSVMYINSDNKIFKVIELLIKCIISKKIIISGYNKNLYELVSVIKILNKKIIYIMHGSYKYENFINNLGLNDKLVNKEFKMLKKVDLILCVSEKYMNWVKYYYADLCNIDYLNNGIDQFDIIDKKRNRNNNTIIAVLGGNRSIKNNIDIINVVNELNNTSENKVFLNIYGRIYENNDILNENQYIKIKGFIDHSNLINDLKKTDIFISNSELEPFGLAVFDALSSGCDILLSKNTGAMSILRLNDNDIIYNSHDTDEIKSKLIYLISNPNNHRICSTINFNDCTWKEQASKLMRQIENL